MKKLFILALLPIMGIVLFGGSCFKKSTDKIVEKQIKSATGVDADINTNKKEFHFKDKKTGQTMDITTSGKAPDNWPDDIPLYDGDIVFSNVTNDGIALSLQTKDDVKKITDWYEQKMEKEGWKSDMNMKTDSNWTVSYKKDKRSVSIMVDGSGDETGIMVNYMFNALD